MITASSITGLQKAAILLLALGSENSAPLFGQLHEDELKDISIAMARLGRVPAEIVETVCSEFSKGLGEGEVLVGSFDSTERLLSNILPPIRVSQIMEEIRGPIGRTMWEKLENVSDVVLAKYLKNEYPQTVAVILSKIKPEQSSRVLALLPEEFALDIMIRMLKSGQTSKDVLLNIEQTLRQEFVSNISRNFSQDRHEQIANIFNNFDSRLEKNFMSALDHKTPTDAERVRALMFTFEDISHLPENYVSILLSKIDRSMLSLALKGASEELKHCFLNAMSDRAGRLLVEEISSMGPVRLKDVEAAKASIIEIAKNLANEGDIELSSNLSENEMLE
ncbi:flagellar motor switch protein FliG [Kozakia baliensis]|uniref:flagellar motor switch protein FliG n=1 Tax=Kozakia baliensis TaxID=153496 RepID=UPI000496F736|nr:flagellar motor switch protein FliG [Kozakia baliensis]